MYRDDIQEFGEKYHKPIAGLVHNTLGYFNKSILAFKATYMDLDAVK